MNKYKMCWLRKFSHQHILYFHLSPRDQKGYLYTNIIEGYHRQVRKVTKTKTAYPTDDALRNGQCRSVNGKVAYIGLLWFEVKAMPATEISVLMAWAGIYCLYTHIVKLKAYAVVYIVCIIAASPWHNGLFFILKKY